MSGRDPLDDAIEMIEAMSALRRERRRRARLLAGDPPEPKITAAEMRAIAERLRAENDKLEAQLLWNRSG